ncbi:MAG: PEP-CTERM sorting domain-containing protein [Pirellulales bacterium]|nr:PEP-CTERM sorting domain-containing protein [Pirellulales bacterium]
MKYILSLASLAIGILVAPAYADDITWDGGDGFWADFNWNGGLGPPDMSGWDSAIIGSGTVTFDAVAAGADFLTMPWSDLTIRTGGTWTQTTTHWNRINGGFYLDGGSFIRPAAGNLVFGSNDSVPNGTWINIGITNGGTLRINGNLWFGYSGDATPFDLEVTMTIDDGSVELTGGVSAAWWLWDDNIGFNSYSINFIGPGSIRLGGGGIQPESAGGPVTFQTLWDMGILQYNGQSATNFDDHFTIAGTFGNDGYTLISGAPNRLTLEVNRETGNITLSNQTVADTFVISAYNLLSEVGAFNPTAWLSIADNYDADSGPPYADPDDNWIELGATASDIAEGTLGTTTLSPGTAIDLGNVWIKSIHEDIQIEILGDQGTYLEYFVLYTGNDGSAYEMGDLNFDNEITVLDWQIYKAGIRQNLAGLSIAESYKKGDLDGDGDNDLVDFGIFRGAYDVANGSGAFDAMVAGVPEPASLVLLVLGTTMMLFFSRPHRWLRQPSAFSKLGTFVVLCFGLCTLSARADWTPVFEYSFPASYNGTGSTLVDLSGAGNNATFDSADGALMDNRPPGFDTSLMSITGASPYGRHGDTDAIDLLDNDLVAAAGGFTMDLWFQWEGIYTNSRKLLDYAGTEALVTRDNQAQFRISDSAYILGAPIVANTWYHLVAVFDSMGNTPYEAGDANSPNDPELDGMAYLYLDGVLVDSEAVTKTGYGDALNRPIGINRWAGGGGEWYQGLNFNPSVYLGIPGLLTLTLEVNTTTGAMVLRNDSGKAMDINAYEILSAGGALNSDGWISLQDQNLVDFPAGNGTGNGWEESGTPNAGFLGETYLLGDSTFADTLSIDLGSAYNPFVFGLGNDGDLVMNVRRADGLLIEANIEYITGGGNADFDSDGDVDGADFLAWQRGFGGAGGLAQGDANADGAVDGADLAIWKSQFGLGGAAVGLAKMAIPEPSTLGLGILFLSGLAIGWIRRWRGSCMLDLSARRLVLGIVALGIVVSLPVPAMATVTLDRDYQMGDDPNEDAQAGISIGYGAGNIAFGSTLDSAPVNLQHLVAYGGTYVDVGPSGLSRPGAGSGSLGVEFDGSHPDTLQGTGLGFPGNDPPQNPVDDYSGVYSRGIQVWVYPTNASSTARQDIVNDTYQFGLHITADHLWGMTWGADTSTTTVGRIINSTESVAYNTWTHVHQHSSGSSGILYINGIAVAASAPGQYYHPHVGTGQDLDLSVGTACDLISNPFTGAVDNLQIYVAGGPLDYGTYNTETDNGYIAALGLVDGDLTGDGFVQGDGSGGMAEHDDVGVFVEGWKYEKILNGWRIGDLETRQTGDFNYDGIVSLLDWHILRLNHATGAAGVDLGELLAAAGVPEPSSFVLAGLWLGLGGVVLRLCGQAQRYRGDS